MKLTIYDHGSPRQVELRQYNAVVLDVTTDDGRTVQLVVDNDGEVFLRGWGNIPITVGNMNKMGFHAMLQREEARYDQYGHDLKENAALEEVP